MVTKVIKPKKISKKTKSTLEKITDLIAWFLGSWWGVIFHTAWFSLWLVLDFNINLLTFSVSLEAIFIGIFLLMASNKAEVKRDLRELRQRRRDAKRLEHDIKLDEKADRQLTEIKRMQKEVHEEMKKVRKEIRKLQYSSAS